ncbi:GINS complex subunit 3 [Heterostelium album PN500]|uniref:GINS complex subunit 3 n=1 Tax=Heterostelium pallidum (strain ATCC 26659 / Pp 5 / PN500) TaxID=670386 RepID=D3B9C9_HETP5|nr:GINS complex subunit 3 [Heterostelium album PN500]EFA81841.1 GINS complex subunit 3 [Heterostelium album PN500]|eukprot:XP_020433958.1 GINS complex subunit 3 [Heterostelium album PN500]
MYNEYFDIDRILSEEEMKQGDEVELPFWLAKVLNNNNIISNSPPVVFLDDYQNKILADPKVISMRKYPYYDVFGIKISMFFRDYELSKVLFKVFKQRLFHILVQSMHLRNTDVSKIQTDLTTQENFIFAMGYQSSADYDSWKDGRGDRITSSDKKYTQSKNRKEETLLKKRKRLNDTNND